MDMLVVLSLLAKAKNEQPSIALRKYLLEGFLAGLGWQRELTEKNTTTWRNRKLDSGKL